LNTILYAKTNSIKNSMLLITRGNAAWLKFE
jgi:hypothetical protein